MKLRVYVDTPVFSAYFDGRAADRKSLTREFWQNLDAYERSTSELGVEELRQTADLQLRADGIFAGGIQVIPVTDEMTGINFTRSLDWPTWSSAAEPPRPDKTMKQTA